MSSRRVYALFGVVATLVGMAVGHLSAALLNPDSSPVLAVGSSVVDLTPTPVKEWAIRTFQSADKTVLLSSVLVGVLVLAAVAGVLTRRRFAAGGGMLLALVAVAAVAVLTRPSVEAVDVVPVVLTALAGLGALHELDRVGRGMPLDPRRPAHEQPAPTAAGPHGGLGDDGVDRLEPAPGRSAAPASASRRSVLVVTGALTAVAAVAGGVGKWVIGVRTRPEDVALPSPASGQTAPALPAGLDDQVPGITPLRTARGDFYRVDTRLDTPVVDSDGWTLTVDGAVENPLEITFDELLDMPMVERDITLTCVSNSVGGQYAGGARWLGVPLTDVLDRAGVADKADQILSTDFDGMTISTPLDLATDGRDALIAVGMNGEPLPREHGFPVRLVIPGLYGFISATKWLTRLTLTTYAQQEAYWTKRDWATDAPIKPSARIDTPRPLAEVDGGEVVVGGVAWAQDDGGVRRVQVQVDGSGWQDAQLGPDVGSAYWRQWFLKVEGLDGGMHSVAARVVDGSGQTQTAARAQPFPDGASGIHTITFTAR